MADICVDKETDVLIDVSDVYKSFRVYYDKSSMLKERFVNPGRSYYDNREILKGVSFKVHRGETLALIGNNGCGKSTTLKMLTRILYPNKGTISVNGKVSSLIELGAGFHPDMSGRENIYINGSVLGLSREEVDSRVDDIIRFSELEEFIDNPIRTYSSGMYMRLAFSVAINVDADILLIDEILAVGDQAFQEKCIRKLDELRGNGVTVVLVSHSMSQVKDIADRCIWIDDGRIVEDGPTDDVCEHYESAMEQRRVQRDLEEAAQQDVKDSEDELEICNDVDKADVVENNAFSGKRLRSFLSSKLQGEGTAGKGITMIFAMAMIILSMAAQDIYSMGTGAKDVPIEPLSIKMQLSAFSLLTVARLGIPMILMLCGFVFMREGFDWSTDGIKKYYIKRLLPLVIIWEISILLYDFWLVLRYGEHISACSVVKQLLFVEIPHMSHAWFPRILFIALLLMPYMWKILSSIKFETMRILLILLWIILFLFSGFDLYGQANGGSQSIPTPVGTLCYLMYACMGYFLSLYRRRLFRGSREMMVICLCFILTIFSGVFLYKSGIDYILWYTFYSVSVIAFFTFDILARLRLPKELETFTNKIASCTVPVFIMFRPIQQLLMIWLGKINGKFMLRTIVLWGLSLLISYLFSYCIVSIMPKRIVYGI